MFTAIRVTLYFNRLLAKCLLQLTRYFYKLSSTYANRIQWNQWFCFHIPFAAMYYVYNVLCIQCIIPKKVAIKQIQRITNVHYLRCYDLFVYRTFVYDIWALNRVSNSFLLLYIQMFIIQSFVHLLMWGDSHLKVQKQFETL